MVVLELLGCCCLRLDVWLLVFTFMYARKFVGYFNDVGGQSGNVVIGL